MSKHLPECFWPDVPERSICICDRLRACEQRVSAKKDEIIGLTAFHSYRAGYDDALEEAEQAVAMKQTQIAKELVEHLWSNEYPSDEGDCCAELVVNSAIAAIRGLREEK